jgi:hypothetical protein
VPVPVTLCALTSRIPQGFHPTPARLGTNTLFQTPRTLEGNRCTEYCVFSHLSLLFQSGEAQRLNYMPRRALLHIQRRCASIVPRAVRSRLMSVSSRYGAVLLELSCLGQRRQAFANCHEAMVNLRHSRRRSSANFDAIGRYCHNSLILPANGHPETYLGTPPYKLSSSRESIDLELLLFPIPSFSLLSLRLSDSVSRHAH